MKNFQIYFIQLPIILFVLILAFFVSGCTSNLSGVVVRNINKTENNTIILDPIHDPVNPIPLLVPSTFKFGMNSVFNFDPVIKKIISNPDEYPLYAPLFSKYHITYLRYPGGIPARYYFWDRYDLTKDATNAISKYYYSQGTKSGGTNGDQYARFTFIVDPNNYNHFLTYVKVSGIEPIIQMNTLFYVYNGKIYQTEPFQKGFVAIPLEDDRWEKIAEYLNEQMDYTHNIFPQSLIWEIGNEDNAIFDAEEYGLIVSKYTDIIKTRYPNDKVIAAMSAGELKSERKAQWNKDFIAYLDKNNALSKVDYFAPHYYIGTLFVSQSQIDIDARIKSSEFREYFDDMKSNFPIGYSPKFSITEFSELLHSDDNINYNTQLDAMLMLDELMKFHSDSAIVSVTKLGFTADKNALFFDKSISNTFSYVDKTRQDSDVFSYIPPQTEAVKIFYDSTGDTIIGYEVTDNYELLATASTTSSTASGTTKYVQILNYKNAEYTIDITKYGQGTYTTYTLPSLTDHYWDSAANKKTGTASGSLKLPAHSFTTVIVQ